MSENTKRIEAYFKKHPPPGSRSRLYPYRSLIEEMRDMGASLRQICDFLEKEEGVKITPKNLSLFIYKMLFKPTDSILKISSTPKIINKIVAPIVQSEEDWMPKIKSGFGLFDP